METVTERSWDKVLRALVKGRTTTLLLGRTDSGKSTLARHLIGRLLSQGIWSALVDADVGQSSLGVPGTISMKVFRDAADMSTFRPDVVFFVGTTNPARGVPAMIEGTRRMTEAARKRGGRAVIIDTTGMVKGSLGRALKLGKILAVRPNVVVALQKGDELEHILASLPRIRGIRIFRLKPAAAARAKRRPRRIAYRRERFREYFKDAYRVSLPLEALSISCALEPCGRGDACLLPGTLIGLSKGRKTLSLGIVEGITGTKEVKIRTPLAEPHRRVDRILVGDIIL
jgi:polynucleotide 5'-hydroxyl-kinase GRC3/NOL9